MELIDVETKLLVSEQELRDRNPLVSFPRIIKREHLDGFSVAEFIRINAPSNTPLLTYTPGPLVEENGIWYTSWTSAPHSLDICRSILKHQVSEIRWNTNKYTLSIDNVKVTMDTDTVLAFERIARGSIVADFKGTTGWIKLSPAKAAQLCDTIHIKVQNNFSNEYLHHAAIDSLENAEAALIYDTNTGWT